MCNPDAIRKKIFTIGLVMAMIFLTVLSQPNLYGDTQAWIRYISAGKKFYVVFDKTKDKFNDSRYSGNYKTDPLGNLKGGATYLVYYKGGKFYCTGYNQHYKTNKTFSNAGVKPTFSRLSLWGRVFVFDGYGKVFDYKYGLVGHLSTKKIKAYHRGRLSFILQWTHKGDREKNGPDIDIWVKDPGGNYLSSTRKDTMGPTRDGGKVDLDDEGGYAEQGDDGTGCGPERVYWPKNYNPRGKFTFGCKYYEGNGTAYCTIRVYSGEQLVKTEKITLSPKRKESPTWSVYFTKRSG